MVPEFTTLHLRARIAQRDAVDEVARRLRMSTGDSVSRSDVLLRGAELACREVGVAWPTDEQEVEGG